MTDFLIRDVDEDVMRRLRERAQRNGRSLQQEVHEVLEEACRPRPDEARRLFEQFESRHALIPSDVDVVDFLREERDGHTWS